MCKIVIIPEISYCWEAVADYLEYLKAKKKEIEKRQCSDPYDCCVEFMEDWLTSDQGVTPKTWHTLVLVLKDISELSSVSHFIEQQLVMKDCCK